MLKKVSKSNFSITRKGAIYVNVKKLFENENVEKIIKDMDEIETKNRAQASQTS